MLIAQLFSKLSVRARIVALALIPVIGILATGIALMVGDFAVGRSFNTVQHDSGVAATSRELETGLLMMRLASMEFASHPSAQRVDDFQDAQGKAMQSLEQLEASVGPS